MWKLYIFVDADASPVQKEVIDIAAKYDIRVFLVKSFAHFSPEKPADHVEVLYVDQSKEAADLAIFHRAGEGDIVVTQDYGLASLCLSKKCRVIHHKGFFFTEKNIDRLLASRHEQAKLRRAGKRTKGPSPYTKEEREKFVKLLESVIQDEWMNQ